MKKTIYITEHNLLSLANSKVIKEEYIHPEEQDEYTIGAEGNGGNNEYFHVAKDLSENEEDEVEANEVDLSSFKKEETLSPKLWDGLNLKKKVRLKLLDIADDFWDYVNLSWVKIQGIILTGSICNYNWSKFSDIDLHIIVDFNEISDKTDFVQDYFDSKKNEWNNEHDGLKIFGFPVELYVEDVHAETVSQGMFNLEKNEWIRKPNINDIQSIELNKYFIKQKAANIMTKIDNYIDKLKSLSDKKDLDKLGKKAHKLLDRIKRMRKFGLGRSGETDSYNILYKVLRREGYLDKLWDISSKLYDKINSLN